MIIRILATKTSDRICAIMNLLQTIDIARHVGNENIETVIDKTKAPAFLPHWTILTAVWPFHSLFWIFFEKLEASLFRAGRHSNSTLYSQSLFLNEGEGRGGGRGGGEGKFERKILNIEYLIFTQINRIDISIVSHIAHGTVDIFFIKSCFMGLSPRFFTSFLITAPELNIDDTYRDSRFAELQLQPTIPTRTFASIFLIISKSFNQGDITIDGFWHDVVFARKVPFHE